MNIDRAEADASAFIFCLFRWEKVDFSKTDKVFFKKNPTPK